MRTRIDAAGRVVIPKEIRDSLGLGAGTEVDIEIDGIAIRMEGVARERGFTMVDGVAVLDPVDAADPLTDEMVRDLRLGLQR